MTSITGQIHRHNRRATDQVHESQSQVHQSQGGIVMATKITYTQQGDYLLPDLKLPEQQKVEIGIWGKRHLRYLKNHRPIIYINLLTSCKLTAYLADIDKEANEMFERLVKQLAEKEGINEQLKANDQMLWVRKMNNIRNQAMEIIDEELIYT